jgi:hypothetical protein
MNRPRPTGRTLHALGIVIGDEDEVLVIPEEQDEIGTLRAILVSSGAVSRVRTVEALVVTMGDARSVWAWDTAADRVPHRA